ncbi:type II secretion system protein N [Pseudomonas sp. GOM7]|uniref:type II secretion system protein N n=1 Tax=Pseudomonas sp. GOM7 TaxID=2998079 RepID=UPI003FA6BE19
MPVHLRLKDRAPTLIGASLLIIMSLALAWQSADLLRLVRGPLPTASSASNSAPTPTTSAPIAQLFGTAQRPESGPPPATNLQLTLLGSFVHSDPQRSSALIQRQGQPAQLYRLGSEVDNGVRLDAVYADHVELLRNGRRESLGFPRPSSSSYSVPAMPDATTDSTLDQLEQLQQDNSEELRQRMQALREQMEAGAVEPENPTDQPQESD